MNSIAAGNFGTGDKNLLKVRDDTVQMNCHVSPVIYKIRDHGPAILDGEFYKDSSNAVLPGKASVLAPAASGSEIAAGMPVVPQIKKRGLVHVMLFSILLLTVALISVGLYAYQQKMHVNDLQAELKIYDDLDR